MQATQHESSATRVEALEQQAQRLQQEKAALQKQVTFVCKAQRVSGPLPQTASGSCSGLSSVTRLCWRSLCLVRACSGCHHQLCPLRSGTVLCQHERQLPCHHLLSLVCHCSRSHESKAIQKQTPAAPANTPPEAVLLCLQVEGRPAAAAAASPEAGTNDEQLRCQVGALKLALEGAQAAHGQALERMATMKVGQGYMC